jgi:hypothetical protein
MGVTKQISGNNRIEATCGQYTCLSAPTGADLFVTYDMEVVKWSYECGGTGHDLEAIWKVSVPYTLLDQHPVNGNYSFGNIRIKDNGGSVLLTSGNIDHALFKIRNEGTDPNCSSNTLFTVSYTWVGISDTYFPGNYVECSFTVYNNCIKTSYNNVVAYTTGPTFTGFSDAFTAVCDRIDLPFFSHGTGFNNCTSVVGAYNLCSPATGITGTDQHQVEYRVRNVGSDLWDDQTSTIRIPIVAGSGNPGTTATVFDACCDVVELRSAVTSSGTWLVRIRNIQTMGGICDNSGATWDYYYLLKFTI